MKIQNDIIEIEAADIAELSPQLQADVTFRAGPQTTPYEYLSARFNAVLEESTHVHEKDLLEAAKPVSIAFARADQATKDSVGAILNVQFLPVDIETKLRAWNQKSS